MSDRARLREAIAGAFKYRDRDGAVIIDQSGSQSRWIADFRSIVLRSEWLNLYAKLFWETYGNRYPFQVAGMETVGIALVAAIVMKGAEIGKPVNGFFIRKSRKKDGLMRAIEGTLTKEPVILVDDLINSGNTFDKQLLLLDGMGLSVTDIFAALRFRPTEAYTFAQERNIAVTALFSLKDFGLPLRPVSEPVVPHSSFSKLWHYQAPHPSLQVVAEKSAPTLFENLVLFGCDDGVLRALDTESGTLVWEFTIGRHRGGKGILSSPAVHDDVVYFGGYDGNVYALDARTGKKKWSYEEADWVGSSPAIDIARGRLYIGLEFGLFGKKGGIVALKLADGSEIWRDTTVAFTHGSPLYIPEEDMVVIGSNDHIVYAYDAGNGARLWTFATDGDIKSKPAYDTKRRHIVVNSMDGSCYVLRARDGEPLFAKEAEFGFYSSPLIHGDTIYSASLDKTLYAFNAETYADEWVFETQGRIFSSPTLFDDSLWVGSNDGRLYELNPQTGALKNFFQATERIVNAPVYEVSSQRIFVPTQANEIYCIKKEFVQH